MSDYIHLEDGRTWAGSSALVSWVCGLTSHELPGKFGQWLRDVADRPNGLAGFDMRGLSPHDRALFYEATARALELAQRGGDYPDAAGSFDRWKDLLRMRDSIQREEPPAALNHLSDVKPFDGKRIEFADIWFCPSCRKHMDGSIKCAVCGWTQDGA